LVDFHEEDSAKLSLVELLNEVAAFLRRYVVMTAAQVDAIALWVAHTWVIEAFEVTGYLAITSPMPRSGKTSLLRLLGLLVPRPWVVIEPSDAVIYRKIEADRPTLLLDEVDAIFGRRREQTEGLRALLNAGNERGVTVPRCIGPTQQLTEFRVFCPKALAGIGQLPETLRDRSIQISLVRKTRDEVCDRFRRRHVEPEAKALQGRIEAWSTSALEDVQRRLDHVGSLADDGGELASLNDREFECAWEPLLAIADSAGPIWRERAISAARSLSVSRDSDGESIAIRLLADIRRVFDEREVDRVSSKGLIEALAADENAPWADWNGRPVTPRAVADLLRRFNILPRTIRLPDGSTPKGYIRDSFEEAWRRYLSPQLIRHTATFPVASGILGAADPPHNEECGGEALAARDGVDIDVALWRPEPQEGTGP
jgi:hypothetical protein